MNIFFLCPDEGNKPVGGVLKLYRHVDILNRHGFQASILHEQTGFRCTWFENDTRITYASDLTPDMSIDFMVIPEVLTRISPRVPSGAKKIIFNQNCYYTFTGASFDPADLNSPYLDPDLLAVLVVSEDSRAYLKHAFPHLTIHRVHNAVDETLFEYHPHKKPQIAFMPRKQPRDVMQVINILKFRGVLKNFDLAPIENKPRHEVAAILKDSLVFLSFGYPEGFSLPPAEAMACGCIVIGYHGMGGMEFFKEEFSYPIPLAETSAFARTVEEVLELHRGTPEVLMEKARKASRFIRENYSTRREEEDVLSFWKWILGTGKTDLDTQQSTH